jgi:peroxiredoxin Q/BCP
VEPVGVNPDDADNHRQFREEHGFPFPLLVDENMDVAREYGALNDDESWISRSVVVIGKDGRVLFSEPGAPAWQRVLNAVKAASDG